MGPNNIGRHLSDSQHKVLPKMYKTRNYLITIKQIEKNIHSNNLQHKKQSKRNENN